MYVTGEAIKAGTKCIVMSDAKVYAMAPKRPGAEIGTAERDLPAGARITIRNALVNEEPA